jgi:hypothetical protein
MAFALLLVSTANLMLAVVPSAGDEDDIDATSAGGGGRGAVNVGGGGSSGSNDDGLGELGAVPAEADEHERAAVSCASLPIDETDECLRDRDRRAAEREMRRKKGAGTGAATKPDKDAALEAYRKRVRRDKALKFKQRDDERAQLAGYQELEARSKEASRAQTRAAAAAGGGGGGVGFAGGAAGMTLAGGGVWAGGGGGDNNTSSSGRSMFEPRPRSPPAPPGAGGEYPVEGSGAAAAARALRPCVPLTPDDDGTDWLPRLRAQGLTLRKREFGRLSKKKQTMKTLRYHHAPALALLPGGQVLAAWQAAESAEGEPGQHVQLSTSDDEGKTWAPSWELPVPRRAAQWSPIPHVDAAGMLHLYYTESDGGCLKPGRPKPRFAPGGSVLVSTVDASRAGSRVTPASAWSTPRVVHAVDDGGDFIPKLLSNPLLAHSSGAWVLPFWRDNTPFAGVKWGAGDGDGGGVGADLGHCRVTTSSASLTTVRKAEVSAGVLVSHDGGATWTARGALRDALAPGAADSWAVGTRTTPLVEHSVVELPGGGGAIALFCRTTTGFVYITKSTDLGRTWSEPAPVDALKDPGGKPQVMSWSPGGAGIGGGAGSGRMDTALDGNVGGGGGGNGGGGSGGEDRGVRDGLSGEGEDGDGRGRGEGGGGGDGDGSGVLAIAWNDHTRDGVEARGRVEKVPEKCRTALSLAVSHDRGDTWQRAGVVAGVVGPGLAPGLRFHHPWILRVGCKLLVAYSKFYVSWRGPPP